MISSHGLFVDLLRGMLSCLTSWPYNGVGQYSLVRLHIYNLTQTSWPYNKVNHHIGLNCLHSFEVLPWWSSWCQIRNLQLYYIYRQWRSPCQTNRDWADRHLFGILLYWFMSKKIWTHLDPIASLEIIQVWNGTLSKNVGVGVTQGTGDNNLNISWVLRKGGWFLARLSTLCS